MSSFFWRNPPQQQVVMGLLRVLREQHHGPVRILDVGSSYGEMITTYAMLLEGEYGADWHRDFQITCIEPNAERVEMFRRGLFRKSAIYQMPADVRERWFGRQVPRFDCVPQKQRGQIIQLLDLSLLGRLRILCAELEVLDNLGGFELICCQNTLFHMSASLASMTTKRLATMLPAGGYFVCAGRHFDSWLTLKSLGFVPVVHDVVRIYESWYCRRSLKEEPFGLKPYDPNDPGLAYKIGSLFQKGEG